MRLEIPLESSIDDTLKILPTKALFSSVQIINNEISSKFLRKRILSLSLSSYSFALLFLKNRSKQQRYVLLPVFQVTFEIGLYIPIKPALYKLFR